MTYFKQISWTSTCRKKSVEGCRRDTMHCINGLPMVSKWIYQVCLVKHTCIYQTTTNMMEDLGKLNSGVIFINQNLRKRKTLVKFSRKVKSMTKMLTGWCKIGKKFCFLIFLQLVWFLLIFLKVCFRRLSTINSDEASQDDQKRWPNWTL